MEQTPKHTRRADHIGIWWTLLGPGGVLVTVFSGIIGFFEPIAKHGWAAVVLAAIAAACAVILVASFGMIGWRLLNPLPKVKIGEAILSSPQAQRGLDGDEITTMIDTRMNEFLASTLRAEFATHAQMHAHDERFIELAKLATDAQTVANGAVEALDALRRQWDAWTHHHVRHNDHRFKSVDGGFKALRDRERLLQFAGVLTSTADWLLRTSKGEVVDDWGLWNHRHFEWRRAMTEYSQVANRYLPEIAQAINEVPTHTLKGEWPEDRSLFPSDDAMIEYRTTAVIMRNFGENHPKIIACVESFAFQAPSMKLIPDD